MKFLFVFILFISLSGFSQYFIYNGTPPESQKTKEDLLMEKLDRSLQNQEESNKPKEKSDAEVMNYTPPPAPVTCATDNSCSGGLKCKANICQ